MQLKKQMEREEKGWREAARGEKSNRRLEGRMKEWGKSVARWGEKMQITSTTTETERHCSSNPSYLRHQTIFCLGKIRWGERRRDRKKLLTCWIWTKQIEWINWIQYFPALCSKHIRLSQQVCYLVSFNTYTDLKKPSIKNHIYTVHSR